MGADRPAVDEGGCGPWRVDGSVMTMGDDKKKRTEQGPKPAAQQGPRPRELDEQDLEQAAGAPDIFPPPDPDPEPFHIVR